MAALILLFHQHLALLFDISVRPKKLVAEPTINSIYQFAGLLTMNFSENSEGKSAEYSSRGACRNCFHFSQSVLFVLNLGLGLNEGSCSIRISTALCLIFIKIKPLDVIENWDQG